ncbi:hypothetical protein KAU32_10025 [bacterium]|nr:hypothetical protein [bacterium]
MKKLTKLVFVIILFIFSVILPSVLEASQVKMIFHKTTECQKIESETQIEKIHSTQGDCDEAEGGIEVTLGLDFFIVDNAKATNIYDFGGKKIQSFDKEKMEYSETSLYAIVAFHSAEFENRKMLGQALLETGSDPSAVSLDLYTIETEFGIESGEISNNEFRTRKKKGKTDHKYGKSIVAQIESSSKVLPKDLKDTFDKFLLYYCSIHPVVRRKIRDAKYIPETIRYNFNEMNMNKTVSLELKKIAISDDKSFNAPEGYKKLISAPELENILQEGLLCEKGENYLDEEDYIEISKKAYNNNDFLNAIIPLMEYFLQEGLNMSEEGINLFKASQMDERVMILMQGLSTENINSEKDVESALELIESLNRDQIDRVHVIDIFRANLYNSIGKDQMAIKLFSSVLKENPYLTGVYIDLGAIYIASYNMDITWDLWSIAKKISPTHPLLRLKYYSLKK